MPIYRYRCEACGAREEHLQKISEDPIEVCSTCGGHLSKQMTAAAFHLKGGGWYKDLYASSKPDSGTGSGGGAAKDSSASSGGDSGTSSSGGGDSGGGGGDSGGGGGSSGGGGGDSGGSGGSSSSSSSSAA